jgi:hypothetical protein
MLESKALFDNLIAGVHSYDLRILLSTPTLTRVHGQASLPDEQHGLGLDLEFLLVSKICVPWMAIFQRGSVPPVISTN